MGYREELIELVYDFTEDNIDITDNWEEWEEFLTQQGFIKTYDEVYAMDLAYLQSEWNYNWEYYDNKEEEWNVDAFIKDDNDIQAMSNGCFFVHRQEIIHHKITDEFYKQQNEKQEEKEKQQKIKQAYTVLKNEKQGIGLKRMDALLYIMKHNFGKEIIYFASDIQKVKEELTKCLSELLNIRNEYFASTIEEKKDYGTVKAIILNKDDTSNEEIEKYVKIIRHLGYGILQYGSDILESDIIILTEYASIQDGYWFSYQNIDDFANYIEDVLSIIEKECYDINDIDYFNEINNKINNVINKYWMNTVEFDYAEFENENNL